MSETMLAAVFEGEGRLAVKQMPIPHVVKPSDVKIKVLAASICGSDIHVLSVPPGQVGKPGTIMGHEFYGTVEAVGDEVTAVAPGDRVVVDPIIACGTCPDCRAGHHNLCLDAVNIGQFCPGGFAEYCVVPGSQVYRLPTTPPASVAAQTEPLACVLNAMIKLNPTPDQRVVIYGAGAIGLIFIRLMRLWGVHNLVVCETLEARRRHAERCQAPWVIDPAKVDVAGEVASRWGGKADIVVDAVGAGIITTQALPLLACSGKYLISGQDNHAVSTIHPAEIVRRELTIIGSYCSHNTFSVAIDLLANPSLGLDLLVSHKVALQDIKKGMDAVADKSASRVIVYPNGMLD
ncbi:MAG: alcohol dehydrogenase catalytic domain-containing protein [Planctomycetaceae bacterium]|nr:alcohol dehydrogenase catalytic domain-containing protein [Planctomycetaceae bacterium]